MIQFHKAHGLANDFLIIEADAALDYAALAINSCARHTGVGADGLLVIEAGESAEIDFGLRFFNSDGSEAEMSGNGIRCAAAVHYANNTSAKDQLRIKTLSGIKLITLRARDQYKFQFQVLLGKPGLTPAEIPMICAEPLSRVVKYPLQLSNQRQIEITAVSTGNPHCSVFVNNFNDLDWRAVGAELERHPAFPNRTNVEFVRVISRNQIEARFWERGAGETESSGTGSCGAALAAILNGFTDRSVIVQTPAGRIDIEWRDDDTLALSGPAEIICQGSYHWPG